MNINLPSPFDIDVTLNGGYLYTTQARLSSIVANQRLTQATLTAVSLKGKSVIDVGCGDGVYTFYLYKKAKPKKLVGIDTSQKAIQIAKKIYSGYKNLSFFRRDIYNLSKRFSNFDLAILRGVIHHVDDPEKAILSIASVSSQILIMEPNGYNPLLKIIEKISPYHRFHQEKSYTPIQIRNWLKKAGYKVKSDQFVGIIPFFFPDTFTVILKKFEPLVEGIPRVRNFLCGVYVVYAGKK